MAVRKTGRKTVRIATRSILTASVVALAMLLSITTRPPVAYGQAAHIRWDLVHFTSFSPPIFEAGGFASAHADDNSTITLTGSGTFVAPAGGGGASGAVTGGGMWGSCDGKRRRDRFLPESPPSSTPQPMLTRGLYFCASSTPMESAGCSSSAA